MAPAPASAPDSPEEPLRPGSLKRFRQIADRDIGNPAMTRFVKSRNTSQGQPRRMALKVATIATSYLNACLDRCCHVTPLNADTSREDLIADIAGCDLLLVETAWNYEDAGWAAPMRHADAGQGGAVRGLLRDCARRGLPTALWFTLDRTHLDIFAHLPGAFGTVLAADPEVARRLGETAGRAVAVLPPAIEPTLHNPLVHAHDGQHYVREDFGICSDSYNELCSFDGDSPVPGLMEPALDHLLWLFETRFVMRNNNARLAKDFRRRFIGCLSDADRAVLLKNSDYYISATPKPDIPGFDRGRNILEAMAFKTLVLGNAAPFLDAVEPFIARTGDPDRMRAALGAFSRDPHLRRMTTHLAYREVMEHHTYADRLRRICDALGLDAGRAAPPPVPLVSAIVSTMRPNMIPFVLDGYRRQSYPNLELVIVLHSDSCTPSDIAPLLREEDRARVIRVPEALAVGTALNAGIDASAGDYWARIDDDDWYGPNYFRDMMLNTRISDFDICGKSQWFIHFEELDGSFAHKKDWAAHSLNPVLAGGTFLVRNRRDGRLRFDDRVRGYADVELLGRAIDEGDSQIVSSDPFNFLQIRRSDRKSHSWTAGAGQIRRSEQISEGLNLARIGI